MTTTAERRTRAPTAAPRDERERRAIERAYSFADLSGYTAKQRFLIRAADLAFYSLIRLIGSTVRFRVEGGEHLAEAARGGRTPIYTTWHDRVFLATYYFRNRRIAVMTSQSFDGEYIARFIRRFGFGAVRGSSTRGGIGALAELVRLSHADYPAGFMIDGPKGPRHEAKMGAVLLARKTGNPVLPFTVTAARRWEAPSWDRLQIPLPFTRARVQIAPPIFVPPDADDQTLAVKRGELQRALDALDTPDD